MRDLLFSFEGRMRRSRWWLVQLGVALAAWGAFLVLAYAFGGGADVNLPMATKLAVSIPMLAGVVAMTWANLATSTKRLHDQGLSGWFYLINFIPVIGNFILLALLGFRDSARGANRFGGSVKYADLKTAEVFD